MCVGGTVMMTTPGQCGYSSVVRSPVKGLNPDQTEGFSVWSLHVAYNAYCAASPYVNYDFLQ